MKQRLAGPKVSELALYLVVDDDTIRCRIARRDRLRPLKPEAFTGEEPRLPLERFGRFDDVDLPGASIGTLLTTIEGVQRWGTARKPKKRLRIIGATSYPVLASIPFEAVRFPWHSEAFAAGVGGSVVRDVPVPRPAPALPPAARSDRPRIGVLFSGPDDLGLDFERAALTFADGYENTETYSWQEWLSELPTVDVLQVWAHGRAGDLALLDDDGAEVPTEEVLAGIADARPALVVLRACRSAEADDRHAYGLAEALVRLGVPVVIGYMGQTVFQEAADIDRITENVLRADLEQEPLDLELTNLPITDILGDDGHRAYTLANWPTLRIVAASWWIDDGCFLRPPTADEESEDVSLLVRSSGLGTAPDVWTACCLSGTTDVRTDVATLRGLIESSVPVARSHPLVTDEPGALVLSEDGATCAVITAGTLTCGVIDGGGTVRWWPSVPLPPEATGLLAVRTVGRTIEVLVGGGGHRVLRVDHGGRVAISGPSPARLRAAATIAGQWLLLHEVGGIEAVGHALDAFDHQGLDLSDLDAASTLDSVLVAIIERRGDRSHLHAVRAVISSAIDPWPVGQDPWSAVVLAPGVVRSCAIDGNAARVRVVRSLDPHDDPAAVVVEVDGQLRSWRWDDLVPAVTDGAG
jgi:hypothetical protein